MRFEIRQSKRNKQWRAYFIGGNNEKVWHTEQYKQLQSAKDAVDLINNPSLNTLPVKIQWADGRTGSH